MDRLTKNCFEWSMRMRRKSATIGFIVKASFVLQGTVRVLSDPEQDTDTLTSGNAVIRVASRITSAASSRLELVIVPSLFVDDMRLAMMSDSQGWHHTKYSP